MILDIAVTKVRRLRFLPAAAAACGEEVDLLAPTLNRPLLLNVVVHVALRDLRVGLVPDGPATPYPGVVATL